MKIMACGQGIKNTAYSINVIIDPVAWNYWCVICAAVNQLIITALRNNFVFI